MSEESRRTYPGEYQHDQDRGGDLARHTSPVVPFTVRLNPLTLIWGNTSRSGARLRSDSCRVRCRVARMVHVRLEGAKGEKLPIYRVAGRRLALLILLVCVGMLVAAGASSALVGASAVAKVPYIQVNGTGDSYGRFSTVIGDTVYVGGSFSQVFEPSSGKNYVRHGLYAYDESSMRVTAFAPNINGPVWGLAHSPNGRFLYVAGDFSEVNGVARKGLARFDLETNTLTSFNAHLNAQARTVDYVGGHLIVGGTFNAINGVSRVALASLDPNTGALQSYVNANLSGKVSSTAGATAVYHTAVNPAGTQMAIAGNFTFAKGGTHWRVLLLNLGTVSATVSAWNAPILQQPCDSQGIPNYVTGLSYSGNGNWFAIATAGFKNSSGPLTATVCDAVSRFSTSAASTSPTWVNYTGCDSLYSVLVAPDAVYVGGHQRWLNNPGGCNSAGPGAVSRPGIGAVDPTTGQALAWDPTRSRGRGADFLEMTGLGLTVLSDCAAAGISGDPSSDSNYLAATFHPCLGVLPALDQKLSVGTAGNGSGVVTSSPAGISCGSICSHTYPSGATVILTAAPVSDSIFVGWSGACTGAGTCTVTMNLARSTVATFAASSQTLSVAKTGKGSGSVTSNPAGISCGSTCSHSYAYDSSVSLTAKSSKRSSFAGWSGDCTGKAACTVSMTTARSVRASFLKACVVPSVEGKSLRVAERTIKARSCRVGRIKHAFSARVKRGHVISQSPRPRRVRKHGARVSLIVSNG